MIKNNASRGFTLIETVVVAVLIMVLALGLFTVFISYRSSAQAITADIKLQRRFDAVMDDIGRKVREANYVFTDAEAAGIVDLDMSTLGDVTTQTIVLMDADKIPVRAYRLSRGFVEVSETGAYGNNDFRPFRADGDTVRLAVGTGLMSVFRLNGSASEFTRMRVTVQIHPRVTSGETDVTTDLHLEKGAFTCRL